MVLCCMDPVLLSDIKYNCDVSDAQYWGYFSVCGLLMRYRELFRSEKGLKPWAVIDREEIGKWIGDKESRWPSMEEAGLRDLTIGDSRYHPFDVSGINLAIRDLGLVYGAGYGMYMKPTFFLAELRSVKELSGLTVYTSGAEYVRDLFTSPGMLQHRSIFLRLEPLVMLLLYKFSELNARHVTSLEDAFAQYGFRHRQIIDAAFEKRMESMAERYAEVLLSHEIAESHEEVPEWKDLLTLSGDRKVEQYLRAVKDLVADTSDHGPYKKIIDGRDRGALSLTVALMEGYRKVLYPGIREAYDKVIQNEDWAALERTRREGYERFRSQRDSLLALYHESNGEEDFIRKIKAFCAS